MNKLITAVSTAAPSATISTGADHALLTTADNSINGEIRLTHTAAIPGGTWNAPNFCPSTPYSHNSMKNLLLLCITAAAAAVASIASAQTTYNGTGSGAALDIDLSENWTNALPTSALNPGTITTNSTVDASGGNFTYTGYYITLTGGTMTQHGVGNDPNFSGGTFNVNGGTYGTSGGRTFRVSGGNVATLTSGTINSGSNGGSNIVDAASLTVNGGLLQRHGTNRSISLTNNSSLTVNGGTVTMDTSLAATGIFGVNNLATGNNTINLNGGNTTANFLAFGSNASTPRLRLTLDGTTAGAFTAVDFQVLSVNEVIGARRIDWLPDSLMTMTLTAAASNWAETEWAAGRMTYNGTGVGTLGNWATVTTTGFGDSSRFNMAGNTLSIVAVPEPVSLAAVGLVGLLILGRIRRHGRKA